MSDATVRTEGEWLVERSSSDVVAAIDLREGDGMCMGYHGWREGDFGKHPVAVPKL